MGGKVIVCLSLHKRKGEEEEKTIRFCCSVGTDIDVAPVIYFQPFLPKLNGHNNLIPTEKKIHKKASSRDLVVKAEDSR